MSPNTIIRLFEPGDAAAFKALNEAWITRLFALEPHDIEVLDDTDTILCTCGDGAPSLQAAVDALLGRFTPTGRLPVPVKGVS